MRFSKIFHFVAHEFKKALAPTLYFLVVFHIAMWNRHLIEASYGLDPAHSFSATIGALVLGKIFLLLNESSLMQAFSKKPLVINTLWRTLLYSMITSVVFVLEEMIPEFIHQGNPERIIEIALENFNRPQFLANHVILAQAVLIYCFASRLIIEVGPKRVFKLFFSRQYRL